MKRFRTYYCWIWIPFLTLETLAWVRTLVPRTTTFSNPLIRRQSLEPFTTLKAAHRVDDNDDAKFPLRLLLIDHYDSFTYNLVDLLAQLCVEPPTVVSADTADSWEELLLVAKNGTVWDGIIFSPGPGSPNACTLAADVVRQLPDVPILGVCLGHQVLGAVYGAPVTLAPRPMHGQVRPIVRLNDTEDPLWQDLPHELNVTRYHSLQVDVSSSQVLHATAVSPEDGVCMGLRHATHPHFGVQFHPESIGTPTGKQLLENFCRICEDHAVQSQGKRLSTQSAATATKHTTMTPQTAPPTFTQPSVYICKVPDMKGTVLPPQVMSTFLSQDPYSFWLDHASANKETTTPAISILGHSRRQQRVEYWGQEHSPEKQGLVQWNEGQPSVLDQDILGYLQQHHATPTQEARLVTFDNEEQPTVSLYAESELQDMLSFDYRGGHVGYLGYEVRHDTARFLEREGGGHTSSDPVTPTTMDSQVPTAAFLWADQSFVYDHGTDEWYLVGVVAAKESPRACINWMRKASSRLSSLAQKPRSSVDSDRYNKAPSSPVVFRPKRSREVYNRNFDQCMHHIVQGDSYELCLTNQLEATVKLSASNKSPLDLYSILRRRNPAPFSAFLNWNAANANNDADASLAICCSSPERFVSVRPKPEAPRSFQVQAKPIKGTAARVRPAANEWTAEERYLDQARAQALRESVKDRAENLMIVDLLRHDLSRVCETGSVHVAKLCAIESFQTVHQMVSTVEGTLRDQQTAVDLLYASFPGGSMTGAPKLRTTQLLHGMEQANRGVYSGCLGYISWNGSMDMNILIRTAVVTSCQGGGQKVTIGAGGAITALSDQRDEYEEMMLKAQAVMEAVQEWANNDGSFTSVTNGDSNEETERVHRRVRISRPALERLSVTNTTQTTILS